MPSWFFPIWKKVQLFAFSLLQLVAKESLESYFLIVVVFVLHLSKLSLSFKYDYEQI